MQYKGGSGDANAFIRCLQPVRSERFHEYLFDWHWAGSKEPSTGAFYKSYFPAPFKPDTTDAATMFHTWLAPEIFSLWLRLFGISCHISAYVYETESDAMEWKISVTLERWKNCPSDGVKLGDSRTVSYRQLGWRNVKALLASEFYDHLK